MGVIRFCNEVFCLVMFAVLFPHVPADMELFSRKPVQVPLIAGQVHTYYVDMPKYYASTHVVFQAHTQWYPVNITYAPKIPSPAGQYAVGTNVGLVSVLKNKDPFRYTVTAVAGPEDVGYVNVLVSAIVYGADDPIPGACNLDLPLKNDPNLYTRSEKDQIQVLLAYGNANDFGWACGDRRQLQIEYVIYQRFVDERHRDEENFMANLRTMIDAEAIPANAHEITTLTQKQKLSVKFAAYTGQGVIYSVILRTRDKTGAIIRTAAYVPVVTYSCNEIDGSCNDPNEPLVMIILICFGVCGLIVCFFGHRWLLFEMLFFGFLAFQLISFILITRLSSVSLAKAIVTMTSTFVGSPIFSVLLVGLELGFLIASVLYIMTPLDCLYVSLGCGAAGGIAWMLFWTFVGSPIFSVLLVGLELGFLIASVLYIMTPLALFDWLLVDYMYYLVFFATVLLINAIFLLTTRFLNILSCSVIGSYLVILAVDWFLKGGVRQLILNSVRKCSIPGFTSAYSTMPFQVTDLALCILWVLLSVTGVAFQLYRERDRPPFPACPWSQFRFRQSAATMDSEYQPAGRRGSRSRNDEDETDPLLGSTRRPGRTRGRGDTPRSSSAGTPTAPHWEPGERMWRPDAAASQSLVAPPPYSSQPA